MLKIRIVEEALADRYAEQEMRCPMHLCIGQEAIAVGVSAALTHEDMVFSNHRAHGHYLAKGGDLRAMVAEIYGKASGCCSGRGGSMHLIDKKAGFMGSTPIVGGTIPVATGAAWANKLKGADRVVVVYFGDGCFEEGVIHESINFAVLHALPIVYVCENNNFSVYTKLKDRQPDRSISNVARAHGLESFSGDGNSVLDVARLADTAVTLAKNGKPTFLEFETYRWREHCGPNFDNDLGYRSDQEIVDGLARCPIDRFIGEKNFELAEVENIRSDLESEIEAVFFDVLADFSEFAEVTPQSVYVD